MFNTCCCGKYPQCIQTSNTSLLELTKKEWRSLRRKHPTGKAECPSDFTFSERAIKVTQHVLSPKTDQRVVSESSPNKSSAFLVTCFPLHHDPHLASKRNNYPFIHVFSQSLLRKHGVTFPIQVDTRSLLMPIKTEGLFSSSISKTDSREFSSEALAVGIIAFTLQ